MRSGRRERVEGHRRSVFYVFCIQACLSCVVGATGWAAYYIGCAPASVGVAAGFIGAVHTRSSDAVVYSQCLLRPMRAFSTVHYLENVLVLSCTACIGLCVFETVTHWPQRSDTPDVALSLTAALASLALALTVIVIKLRLDDVVSYFFTEETFRQVLNLRTRQMTNSALASSSSLVALSAQQGASAVAPVPAVTVLPSSGLNSRSAGQSRDNASPPRQRFPQQQQQQQQLVQPSVTMRGQSPTLPTVDDASALGLEHHQVQPGEQPAYERNAETPPSDAYGSGFRSGGSEVPAAAPRTFNALATLPQVMHPSAQMTLRRVGSSRLIPTGISCDERAVELLNLFTGDRIGSVTGLVDNDTLVDGRR